MNILIIRSVLFVSIGLVLWLVNALVLCSAQDSAVLGKIAFTKSIIRKNFMQIYVIDMQSRHVVQLTEEGRNGWPRWSPDGKQIIFASDGRKTHNNREIYVMDADGSNQRRLTYSGKGNASDPIWDNSGDRIFFRSAIRGDIQRKALNLKSAGQETLSSTGGVPDIRPINNVKEYINELKGKDSKEAEQFLRNLENDREKHQYWFASLRKSVEWLPSPDGRYLILYFDFTKKIVLMDLQSGDQKELQSSRPRRPAWSKDSKKIAYIDGDTGGYFSIYDVYKDNYSEIKISGSSF